MWKDQSWCETACVCFLYILSLRAVGSPRHKALGPPGWQIGTAQAAIPCSSPFKPPPPGTQCGVHM